MHTTDENSLYTELTPEEEASVSGGWNILDFLPQVSAYVDPDGNPKTRPNYYFGNFNQRPSAWPGVKWEIRVGNNTWAKGYGQTPGYLLDWLRRKGVRI